MIGVNDGQGTKEVEPRGTQAEGAEIEDERFTTKPEAGSRAARPARQVNRSAEPTSKAAERRSAGPHAAGESQFLRTQRNSFACNDRGDDRPSEESGAADDEECRFEIFRKDKQRMTSTLFAGGDWRWQLVTTGGLILAEASGYPSEAECRAAIAALQKRAATAPVFAAPGDWQ